MKNRRQHRARAQGLSLDEIFGALADPIRRAMLTRLSKGECPVGTLAEPFAVSAPAISRHLRVLERSGLVIRRKSGRVHYCRLRAEALQRGGDWIQRLTAFWEGQFDALSAYLDKEQS